MAKGEKGTAKPYRRGKVWWIKYYVPGHKNPRRESSKSVNKNDAIRLLNQRRSEIDTRQFTVTDATVRDLLDLYLQDQRKQKRKSLKQAEGYVRLHLDPAFGKLKAATLTSGTIDRFIEQKRAQQYRDASINRMLEPLRRAFRLGLETVPPLIDCKPIWSLWEK